MQPNACTNNLFPSISTRFNITTLADIKHISKYTSLIFVHTIGYVWSSQYSSRCCLVDNSQLFLTGQLLVSLLFIAILTSFLNSKFFVTSCLFTFYRKIIASHSSQLRFLATQYPNKQVHGLRQSCMARLYSTPAPRSVLLQVIVILHGTKGYVAMQVSGNTRCSVCQCLKNRKRLQSFHCLIVLEAKCCLCKGIDFIVCLMTHMLKHINATMQAFTRITGSIFSCLVIQVHQVLIMKERDKGE